MLAELGVSDDLINKGSIKLTYSMKILKNFFFFVNVAFILAAPSFSIGTFKHFYVCLSKTGSSLKMLLARSL